MSLLLLNQGEHINSEGHYKNIVKSVMKSLYPLKKEKLKIKKYSTRVPRQRNVLRIRWERTTEHTNNIKNNRTIKKVVLVLETRNHYNINCFVFLCRNGANKYQTKGWFSVIFRLDVYICIYCVNG